MNMGLKGIQVIYVPKGTGDKTDPMGYTEIKLFRLKKDVMDRFPHLKELPPATSPHGQPGPSESGLT